MQTTTGQRLTFEEYLNWSDDTDQQHEFVEGQPVAMPPESPRNSKISLFLLLVLSNIFSEERLCHKDTELVVSGPQIQTRVPDLMVLSEELAGILERANRGTITLDMPPPDLVIEVASPGKTNQERDYRYRRSEYAARGIPEYWVVDPDADKVTIFTLVSGFYDPIEYVGDRPIQSQFVQSSLTAKQILTRKRA